MNTTASFSSEPSWSRRCSIESIYSIQGKETDFVRDTTDTEWLGSDDDAAAEYEPASEPDDAAPISGDSSGHSDNEIISTKVIEVSIGDDGELQLADSELTASSTDSEMDLHDYWLCAHCRAQNNNPLYRYCEKCFTERKNFFPPRPKRKRKRMRSTRTKPENVPRTLSQDSGVETAPNSQDLSQNDFAQCSQNSITEGILANGSQVSLLENSLNKTRCKRRAESVDTCGKRVKIDSETDSDSDTSSSKGNLNSPKTISTSQVDNDSIVRNSALQNIDVIQSTKTVSDSESNIDSRCTSVTVRPLIKMVSDTETDTVSFRNRSLKTPAVTPLVKMVSDPALTVEETVDVRFSKKAIVNSLKGKLDMEAADNVCIVCLVEPKSGVFVHGRIAHICCCYKCAVKVWSKAKRCPVCNCKVSNVLKAVVM